MSNLRSVFQTDEVFRLNGTVVPGISVLPTQLGPARMPFGAHCYHARLFVYPQQMSGADTRDLSENTHRAAEDECLW